MILHVRQRIAAPAAVVFDCVRDIALHARAVARIQPRVERGPREGLEQDGTELVWSARYFGRRWKQTMRTSLCEPPRRLRQECIAGPWRVFEHNWTLTPVDAGHCQLEDQFRFESPGGSLGRELDRALMASALGPVLDVWLERIKGTSGNPRKSRDKP